MYEFLFVYLCVVDCCCIIICSFSTVALRDAVKPKEKNVWRRTRPIALYLYSLLLLLSFFIPNEQIEKPIRHDFNKRYLRWWATANFSPYWNRNNHNSYSIRQNKQVTTHWTPDTRLCEYRFQNKADKRNWLQGVHIASENVFVGGAMRLSVFDGWTVQTKYKILSYVACYKLKLKYAYTKCDAIYIEEHFDFAYTWWSDAW